MANSVRRNGTEDTVRDYVTRPRDSGYRAVHLWTRYRGLRVEANCGYSMWAGWSRTSRGGPTTRAGTRAVPIVVH